MLFSRSQLRLHLMMGIPATIFVVVCLIYYLLESVHAGSWLGGGSGPGLVCGIAAGSVIVFEMLLWPRKRLRRLRLIATKYWLAAHIWFGLASLPLAIAHTGLHLGGWLPATFIILFVLTIISGIYGMIVQNILPRWLLRNVQSETIYSQIDYVSAQAVNDLQRILVTSCGRSTDSTCSLDEELSEQLNIQETIVVGAVRQAGKTTGRTLETRKLNTAKKDAKTLWDAFVEIRPFLMLGKTEPTPVTSASDASGWFRRLRLACSDEGGEIIDAFENACGQRRQFDTQATVHSWLHAWIPIHIALSIAVTLLLAAHVWTALQYW